MPRQTVPPITREILVYLFLQDRLQHKELAAYLNIDPHLVSEKLNRLDVTSAFELGQARGALLMKRQMLTLSVSVTRSKKAPTGRTAEAFDPSQITVKDLVNACLS